MNDDFVTTEKILETLKGWIEKKVTIPPHIYVEAAAKLNILSSDDYDKLAQKQFELAQSRELLSLQEPNRSVASLKLSSEANPLSLEINLLKGKLKIIDEAIKIAKLQARLSNDEIKNY